MINSQVEAAEAYYHELRTPMLSLIKGVPRRVLEIGCAAGENLIFLKSRGSDFTVGVECSPEVAAFARTRGVDEVIIGDVEKVPLPYPLGSFDLIIASHVLEHLSDPWAMLTKLKPLLASGGQLVGALPNVRHHSVVLPLLVSGTWRYQQSGIMDWTHLRFFSRKTVLALLKDSGFEVEAVLPEFGGRKSRLANLFTCHLFRNFLSFAYIFSAVKPAENSSS